MTTTREERPVADHATEEISEAAILGAVLRASLTDPDTAAGILQDTPDPTDYTTHRHHILAAHLAAAANDNTPLDPAAILGRLTDAGDTKPGYLDGAWLHTLIEAAPPTASVPWHTARVQRASRVRKANAAVTRAAQRLATPIDADDTLDVLLDLMGTIEEAARDEMRGTNSRDPISRVDYLPMNGLLTRPRTIIPWHTKPLIAAGRVTLLYSPGKVGKSLLPMESAAALATGRGALSTNPTGAPIHVLYIDQEMTPDDWSERLRDMGYTPTDEPALAQHLHLAQLHAWPPMDSAAGGAAVHNEVEATGAQVVIIDTVSKVIAGEENSNDTQQAVYRHTIVPLKRAGIGVLILDHTGKDLERGARGGSAKTDNIDLAFELLPRAKERFTLRCTHARFRDDILTNPIYLHRETTPTLTHTIEERDPDDVHGPGLRPTHLMDKVSRYVEASPGCTQRTITDALGGKTQYVRLALELLINEAYIDARPGPRRSIQHYQIRPFRMDEEDDE